MRRVIFLAGLLLAVFSMAGNAAPRKVVRVGFFEAGDYYTHSIVRNEYRDALEHLIPSNLQILYLQNGYKSANWKKDQCAAMAAEFARDSSIDIVVAIGPWVIEELLKAGFDRPIVGLWQNDPEAEGLLGSDRRPIAGNLTVQTRPDQLRQDMIDIIALYHPKVLGVLAFNNGIRDTAFYEKCWQTGKKLGLKVVWAQGYNADGTFAFFKGYSGLPKPFDALYVGPLWGLALPAIDQFTANASRDLIPIHTSEGRYLVEKGLSSSSSIRGEQGAALFAAWKTVRIAQGSIPADLPLEYPGQRGFVLNKSILEVTDQPVSAEIWSQAEIVDEFTLLPVTEVLTLAEVLSNAETQNPGLQAMISRIDAAGQRLENLRGGYLPSISIEGSATAASSTATDNTGGVVSKERYRAGVELRQPLFAPSVIKSVQAAKYRQVADSASYARAEIDLQRSIRATYRDCLSAQQQVIELTGLRDRIVQLKEIARLNAFAGENAVDDAPRWELRRLDNVRDLMAARRVLAESYAALHLLMGRPVLDTVIILDSTGCTSGDLIDQFVPLRMIMTSERFGMASLAFLQSEALQNNPAMKEQSAQIGVAESNIALGSASRYPNIGLRGWFGFVDSLSGNSGFVEKHNVWSLSANLSWPLIGRSPKAGVAAERDEAVSRKDSARLRVEAAIDAEWKNLWRLGMEMPLTAQAMTTASEYADSVKFDYLRGRRSVLEALDALEADHRARLAQLAVRNAFFQAADNLAGEVGWLNFSNAEPSGRVVVKRVQEYLQRVVSSGQKP